MSKRTRMTPRALALDAAGLLGECWDTYRGDAEIAGTILRAVVALDQLAEARRANEPIRLHRGRKGAPHA